jgi:hypothetical protein
LDYPPGIEPPFHIDVLEYIPFIALGRGEEVERRKLEIG